MVAPLSSSTLIEIIVLCCSKSELKALVGTDALRSVLEGMHRSVCPEPGRLVLQPLYDLLAEQPGFEHELAVAPFSRLKALESQLEIRVEMPTALADMPPAALEFAAQRCEVTPEELETALAPPAPPPPQVPPTPIPTPIASTPSFASRPTSAAARKRAASSGTRLKIAMAAALVSMIAVGVSLYITLRAEPSNVKVLKPTDISDKIPLTDVRRSGQVILGTVADPAWLASPMPQRRLQVEAAAPFVRAQNATELVLVDSKASPVVTLVVRPNPVVTFVQAIN